MFPCFGCPIRHPVRPLSISTRTNGRPHAPASLARSQLGWSLVAGRWSLVAGRWSLVAGFHLHYFFHL